MTQIKILIRCIKRYLFIVPVLVAMLFASKSWSTGSFAALIESKDQNELAETFTDICSHRLTNEEQMLLSGAEHTIKELKELDAGIVSKPYARDEHSEHSEGANEIDGESSQSTIKIKHDHKHHKHKHHKHKHREHDLDQDDKKTRHKKKHKSEHHHKRTKSSINSKTEPSQMMQTKSSCGAPPPPPPPPPLPVVHGCKSQAATLLMSAASNNMIKSDEQSNIQQPLTHNIQPNFGSDSFKMELASAVAQRAQKMKYLENQMVENEKNNPQDISDTAKNDIEPLNASIATNKDTSTPQQKETENQHTSLPKPKPRRKEKQITTEAPPLTFKTFPERWLKMKDEALELATSLQNGDKTIDEINFQELYQALTTLQLRIFEIAMSRDST